jgi:hypothetical protein
MPAERNSRLVRRVSRLAALVCAAGWLISTQRGLAQTSLEYAVKAAFLLNFTKFVEWPPSAFAGPNAPVAICILGMNPFGQVLDEIVQGEQAGGRALIVRKLDRPAAPRGCQVVFMAGSGKDVPKTLRSLGPGVLTVGEGESFLREGGMVAFVIENRRVRFDINRTAAQSANLKLSSQLLTVARTVEK